MGHAQVAGLGVFSQGLLLVSLFYLDPQPHGTHTPAPTRGPRRPAHSTPRPRVELWQPQAREPRSERSSPAVQC